MTQEYGDAFNDMPEGYREYVMGNRGEESGIDTGYAFSSSTSMSWSPSHAQPSKYRLQKVVAKLTFTTEDLSFQIDVTDMEVKRQQARPGTLVDELSGACAWIARPPAIGSIIIRGLYEIPVMEVGMEVGRFGKLHVESSVGMPEDMQLEFSEEACISASQYDGEYTRMIEFTIDRKPEWDDTYSLNRCPDCDGTPENRWMNGTIEAWCVSCNQKVDIDQPFEASDKASWSYDGKWNPDALIEVWQRGGLLDSMIEALVEKGLVWKRTQFMNTPPAAGLEIGL